MPGRRPWQGIGGYRWLCMNGFLIPVEVIGSTYVSALWSPTLSQIAN